MEGLISLLIILAAIVAGIFLILYILPFNIWIPAIFSGVRVN